MRGAPNDYPRAVRLDRFVRGAVARLDPGRYAPGLEVDYGGAVASSLLEHEAPDRRTLHPGRSDHRSLPGAANR